MTLKDASLEHAEEVVAPLPPEAWPKVDDLVTEDDTPVDNLFSEKQQRLLTEPLYSSWLGPGEGRQFLALANVGLFYAVRRPPLVPDVMLSLDVGPAEDVWAKSGRSYFLWEYGKPPEVVIEIVSNLEGDEAGGKLRDYGWVGVPYYVIFDPQELLGGGRLRLYELKQPRTYVQRPAGVLEGVGLGLTLWSARFENLEQEWLRWTDREDHLIPTGAERADEERQRAEGERQRAERLAAQLRALGVEPSV